MKRVSYRILLRPEPEGGYTVIVPSLPGCITYGKTIEEARRMAFDAIKAYLESLKKRRDLPKGTLISILKQAGIGRKDLEV